MLALTVVFAYTAVGAFAATSDASDTFKVGKLEVSGIKDGNTLKLYKIAQFNYDSATNAFDYTLANGLPADYDTIDKISAIQSDGYEFKEGGSAAKTLADTLAALNDNWYVKDEAAYKAAKDAHGGGWKVTSEWAYEGAYSDAFYNLNSRSTELFEEHLIPAFENSGKQVGLFVSHDMLRVKVST